MSILFGCVVKHVWGYRTRPINLYIWPKFWLSTAGLDQWLVMTLPLLMINIRTERANRSLIRGWKQRAYGWNGLLWNEFKKNKTTALQTQILNDIQKSLVSSRGASSPVGATGNLFRAEENIFQQHARQINGKGAGSPTGVKPNSPSRGSGCHIPQIRKSSKKSESITPHHHIFWPNKIKAA